jgi:hypothetical protein
MTLAPLLELRTLILANNHLTDAITRILGRMRNLELLNLGGNLAITNSRQQPCRDQQRVASGESASRRSRGAAPRGLRRIWRRLILDG